MKNTMNQEDLFSATTNHILELGDKMPHLFYFANITPSSKNDLAREKNRPAETIVLPGGIVNRAKWGVPLRASNGATDN